MNKDSAPVPSGRTLSTKLFWTLLLLPFVWPLAVLLLHLHGPASESPQPILPPLPAGATDAPFIRHETIFQPVPEFTRFHAATLALAPNGDLLAACRGDRPGATRSTWDLSAVILFSRKPLGATAWTPPVALSVTPDRMDTNPVLWTDPVFGGPNGTGGRIWLFHGTSFGVGWQFSRIAVRYSDDFGHTWSERRPINGIENLNTRCPPVSVPQPGGGRQIVLPVYREFGQSLCLISNDHGETWGPSEPIVSGIFGNFQPSLILNPDNSIDAYLRASGIQRVLYARSPDGGQSWQPAQPLHLRNPFTSVAAARLEPPHDRYIVPAETALVFNNTDQAERFHLSVVLQRSGAVPWFSAPRDIALAADRDEQQEYPAVLALPNGHFLIAFTLGRNRIHLVECNPQWILQTPGPLTAGPDAPGWRGLPALVALLLFLAAAAILRLLWRRWIRRAASASWEAVAGWFQGFVLVTEAILVLLLLWFGPRIPYLLSWPVLAADNFLSVLEAMLLTAWIALAGCLFLAILRLRLPATTVVADILWLAGPLAFVTVTAGQILWPPLDPAFGAVAVDPAFRHTASTPQAARQWADLRRDYDLEYRLRERTAIEAGPGDPPEAILARFNDLRRHLDETFAATRGLTPAQLAALSPYATGEHFIAPPALQTNQPLFLRALAASLPCWAMALLLTVLARRRRPLPTPSVSPAPPAAGADSGQQKSPE